jgi:sporulation protein YlmC with PRC-barrel domain
MSDLLGDEVVASDERLGALDDMYFDGESWRVRYLVVAADSRRAGELVLVDVSGIPPEPSNLGGMCSGRDVLGFLIEADDGAAGRVADLLLDDETWSIDYLIVDTAEAAGVRRVLVPLDWVAAIDPGRRTVRVQRTREELRDSPGP